MELPPVVGRVSMFGLAEGLFGASSWERRTGASLGMTGIQLRAS